MNMIRTKNRATREKLSKDLFGATGEVAEPDDIATNNAQSMRCAALRKI